jgi:hypothetical protein
MRNPAARAAGERMLPSLFTAAALADYLSVPRSWVYDHAWEIPGRVKIGGLLRFRRDAVLAWIARLEAGASERVSPTVGSPTTRPGLSPTRRRRSFVSSACPRRGR